MRSFLVAGANWQTKLSGSIEVAKAILLTISRLALDVGRIEGNRVTKKNRMGWATRLSRPVAIKNGPTLITLHDVRTYILAEAARIQKQPAWNRAIELVMAAADTGEGIETATRSVENALFLEARWVPAE
jgi:hypothetical protein